MPADDADLVPQDLLSQPLALLLLHEAASLVNQTALLYHLNGPAQTRERSRRPLYEAQRTGQTGPMWVMARVLGRGSRLGVVLAAGLGLAGAGGCHRSTNTPEGVADAFVEAYFQQMDQARAKEYTALGATKMLDAELKSVEEIRKEGYAPSSVAVSVHRGPSAPRDERIRIPYEIEIQTEGAKQLRDADIELTQIQGQWKVVRVGITQRDAPAPQ